VLGWAAASYRGWETRLFALIPLPPLAEKGTRWAHDAGDVHVVLVYVLLGLIALHVAAALYHHVVQRDRVLARMLPLR
jgi:cytochrome b561